MHISKYIRFGDTLERCCKGKAFIWIVQGFLQRKLLYWYCKHSWFLRNKSVDSSFLRREVDSYGYELAAVGGIRLGIALFFYSITQDVVCEVFAKYLEAMVSINPLRTSSFGKSRRYVLSSRLHSLMVRYPLWYIIGRGCSMSAL